MLQAAPLQTFLPSINVLFSSISDAWDTHTFFLELPLKKLRSLRAPAVFCYKTQRDLRCAQSGLRCSNSASWLPGGKVLPAPAGSAAPAAPSSPAPRGAAGHANSMLAAGPPLITRPARSSGSGWSKSGSGWSNSGSGWSNSGSGWSISGSGRSNSDHLVVDISLCRASNCAGKPPVSK